MLFKNNRYGIAIGIVIVMLCVKSIEGMFPINVFKPWDINLRPPRWKDRALQLMVYGETAFDVRAFNSHGSSVNPLQIWDATQDTLAMFKGFDNPEFIDFFDNVLGMPQDDGVRGHVKFSGDFDMKLSAALVGRYYLPHNFNIGVFLPFYAMQLKNVEYVDQTRDVTIEDIKVREELTSKLFARVQEFDPSLNLLGWKKLGFGDLAVLIEWWRDFPQAKDYLKVVNLEGRFGLSIPTGVATNPNDILSVPFGFDGSVAIIFGGGINLMWSECVRAGIDAEFINCLGNTRVRRIKVDEEQTDFLLFAKTEVHKEFAVVERFNLYAETYKWGKGLALGAAYQYWKQGDDKLIITNNNYSTQIANGAASLEEWTMHQFIFTAKYDFQDVIDDSYPFRPHIFAFYKLPINGKRSLMGSMVGLSLTLNF